MRPHNRCKDNVFKERGYAMITEAQRKQYEEEGYLIFDRFFSEQEIKAITSIIDKYDEATERRLRERGQSFINIPGQINFTALINKMDREVQQFGCQPRMAMLAVDILGPDVQLYWDQSVYKRPEAYRDFPWHQDNGYVPTEPEHYLTCWIALEDSTIENGCIWVLPGSHRQGFVEHKKTDIGWQCYFGEDPGIPVPLQRGSMVAFHSLLFHRSTPNRSGSIRKAYILQYSQAGAKNPTNGKVFDNGPVLTLGGQYVYSPENPQYSLV